MASANYVLMQKPTTHICIPEWSCSKYDYSEFFIHRCGTRIVS